MNSFLKMPKQLFDDYSFYLNNTFTNDQINILNPKTYPLHILLIIFKNHFLMLF